MLKRSLHLSKKHSFFLFGPRQTGKSTLIKEVFKDTEHLYYDFLKSDIYNKFISDPSLFRDEILHRKKDTNLIIVDEIQRIPNLLNEIHYLIEEDKDLRFVLSGSSARKLKRSQANLLGGRALSFKLFPLTHHELGADFNLNKALNIGTLPAIYLEEDLEIAKAFLKSYVETYLEEEIKAEALVRNIGSFIRFLKFAAHENGNIINYSNIARETATKNTEVKEYFQILEDTLIGFNLLAYNKSERKKLMKRPKFYFFDTGVQRALSKRLSIDIDKTDPDYGKHFEHFIIKEIIHSSIYQNKDYEFSYYRTENGAEVDLIIETPQKKTFAIEIKSSTNPRMSELKSLKSFQEICPEANLICACTTENIMEKNSIKILPWLEVFKALDLNN